MQHPATRTQSASYYMKMQGNSKYNQEQLRQRHRCAVAHISKQHRYLIDAASLDLTVRHSNTPRRHRTGCSPMNSATEHKQAPLTHIHYTRGDDTHNDICKSFITEAGKTRPALCTRPKVSWGLARVVTSSCKHN